MARWLALTFRMIDLVYANSSCVNFFLFWQIICASFNTVALLWLILASMVCKSRLLMNRKRFNWLVQEVRSLIHSWRTVHSVLKGFIFLLRLLLGLHTVNCQLLNAQICAWAGFLGVRASIATFVILVAHILMNLLLI